MFSLCSAFICLRDSLNSCSGTTQNTPIHEAVTMGASSILKVLVLHGAKLDAANAAGDTPLQLAINERNHEMAHLLESLENTAI